MSLDVPTIYVPLNNTSTTDIKFQGLKNSCYLYGTLTSLEKLIEIEDNKKIKLSIQKLERHIPSPTIPAVLNYLSKSGITTGDGKNIKISGYITLYNSTAMKNWLVNKGSLITSIRLYWDFFFYRKGVYRNNLHIPFLNEYHCMTIIGYDDIKGAWLCQNSWSRFWGMGGYCWIKYGTCGIDKMVYGISGIID